MTYALSITLTNETEGHQFSDWTEDLDKSYWHLLTDAGEPDFGAIFRAAQEEYGRCQSSVYVDQDNAPPRRVGWFFVSRQQYEDTREPYLRGAWVTVIDRIPERHEYVGLP